MKFICLGYFREQVWAQAPQSRKDAMMEECLQYDDVLRREGHFGGGQALQSASTAKTLRQRDGKILVTDGPYTETKEQLGGFLILEARDMNEAVELMSRHPGARYGHMEIRPVDEAINALVEARTQRAAKLL